jgi:hypothetical protein
MIAKKKYIYYTIKNTINTIHNLISKNKNTNKTIKIKKTSKYRMKQFIKHIFSL